MSARSTGAGMPYDFCKANLDRALLEEFIDYEGEYDQDARRDRVNELLALDLLEYLRTPPMERASFANRVTPCQNIAADALSNWLDREAADPHREATVVCFLACHVVIVEPIYWIDFFLSCRMLMGDAAVSCRDFVRDVLLHERVPQPTWAVVLMRAACTTEDRSSDEVVWLGTIVELAWHEILVRHARSRQIDPQQRIARIANSRGYR